MTSCTKTPDDSSRDVDVKPAPRAQNGTMKAKHSGTQHAPVWPKPAGSAALDDLEKAWGQP